MKIKNILITGASGFLGTHLCKRLEKEGHKIIKISSSQCDLTKENSLFSFMKEKNITLDEIIHLAAWTQAGDFCLYHQGEQWLINQKINTNVLDYWYKSQPQAKMIAIGTSCSYDPNLELKEENYMVGTPIDSLYTYAMTKRMLYVGLKALNKQYGLNYIYFVPSTLYGPGYHNDGRQMHFIFDIIRKILKGKIYGDPVILWGDGYQKREIIHVEDFISIMLKINELKSNEIINIGYGKEYSIREFAKIICEKTGYDFNKIQFDTTKYVGAKSKVLDITKLQKILPEYKNIPLEQGILKTLEWFMENKDTLLQK